MLLYNAIHENNSTETYRLPIGRRRRRRQLSPHFRSLNRRLARSKHIGYNEIARISYFIWNVICLDRCNKMEMRFPKMCFIRDLEIHFKSDRRLCFNIPFVVQSSNQKCPNFNELSSRLLPANMIRKLNRCKICRKPRRGNTIKLFINFLFTFIDISKFHFFSELKFTKIINRIIHTPPPPPSVEVNSICSYETEIVLSRTYSNARVMVSSLEAILANSSTVTGFLFLSIL